MRKGKQKKKRLNQQKQIVDTNNIIQTNNNNPQSYSLVDILEVYEQVNETQRYEGAGIWSRFNIIISLNIILFGTLTFIISNDDITARLLFMVVSLSGALFSLWGIYVLRRLWLWHYHWKNTLQEIELMFPKDFPTPFLTRPKNLIKSYSWFKSWILSYTQPFILILLFMWVTLFFLSYTGLILKKHNGKEKTEVEIILKDEVKSKEIEILKDSTNTIK